MAAWNSLAGYLVLRPAGALSRLKTRKRQWYVFDESGCQLLYYKTEADSRTKQPLGIINVKGAAISLTLEENNQFVIHSSDGKEHALSADTHESMMLWVLALQAKRDASTANGSVSSEKCAPNWQKKEVQKTDSYPSDQEIQTVIRKGQNAEEKPKIFRAHSLHLNDKKKRETTRHSAVSRMRSLWMGQNAEPEFSGRDKILHSCRLSPLAQSGDASDEEENRLSPSQPSAKTTSKDTADSATSSSTLVEAEVAEADLAVTDDNNNDNNSPKSHPSVRRSKSKSDIPSLPASSSSSVSSSSSSDSCDSDTFEREDAPAVSASRRVSVQPKDKAKLLRQMNSDDIRAEDLDTMKNRTNSLSGTSMSSDSAMGMSESSYSSRLQELESDLITIKCELAKALNRESAYKSEIEEKESMVTELKDRLQHVEVGIEEICKTSPAKGPVGAQRLQEKCRILQNHNRFLNEEVLKLSRALQQEQGRNQMCHVRIRDMEAQNDQFKRDYVFLLQSCLRITSTDGPEAMEVYLYGGARHKERVLMLLEEARKINPTLPSYESLRSSCHVDPLGFKYTCTDEGFILHYICRQLHQHYSTLLPTYERHQQQWKRYIKLNPTMAKTKELKSLIRAGVPPHLRRRVWCGLYRARIHDVMEEKGTHYYNYLCSVAPESEKVTQHRRQIALDLLRTMPENTRFCDQNADGVRKMQEVLQAFCLHNPSLGYCQGMNFLAGMCLLFMEPEDTFWCLIAITERYFTPSYFDHSLIGAQADQEVLKELLKEKMPELASHLETLDIEVVTVTLNWFLAIFFDCLPFETLVRIWDCFLLEGPKVLFRFALAIMKLNEAVLLSKHDTVSIMRQLKASAKLCFDVDSVMKIAFSGLKPFPSRHEISTKQAYYYKNLKEQSKRFKQEKEARRHREKMLTEMDIYEACQLVIECAAVYDRDKLWLCHGHQNGAQISKVNCEENVMYCLKIELESRVMCIHTLDDDTMLLGTLSHFVYAFSTKSRKLMWETRLNNSILSLCSHEEDGLKLVYAGLADGTVAVIENFQGRIPKPEVFYILIGPSPVTCLRLVDRRLWCACGNRVMILSARTLDTVDQFQISSSCLDYISMLVPGQHGVWVAIRGSSVLQLWDPQMLTCRLLYDIKDNSYPRSPRQDEEACISQTRITALLPFDGTVLVGTAEGSLIFYEISSRLSHSTSAVDSPFPRGNVSANSRVDEIQERIQEILMERQRREETETNDERQRSDSGCYTTPTPTPIAALSRRESTLLSETLPTTVENEFENEFSPEDKSEDTSGSTIKQLQAKHNSMDTIASPDIPHDWEEEEISMIHDDQNNINNTLIKNDLPQSNGFSLLSETAEPLVNGACNTDDETEPNGKPKISAYKSDRNEQNLDVLNPISSLLRKQDGLTNSDVVPKLQDTSLIKEIEECDCGTLWCKNAQRSAYLSQIRQNKQSESKTSSTYLPPQLEKDSSRSSSISKSYKALDLNFREEIGKDQKFLSLTELQKLESRKKSPVIRSVSADDIRRWLSGDNLSSSLASDSYEFDDVFITYTEDEMVKTKLGSGYFRRKGSEAMLKSLRKRNSLHEDRRFSFSVFSDAQDLPTTDHWLSWRVKYSRSILDTSATSRSSLFIDNSKLADVRSQLPKWQTDGLITESDVSSSGACIISTPQEIRTTEDLSHNSPNWFSCEEETENESVKVSRSRDLLQLGEWTTGTQKSSDTASSISFSSTDVPYSYELTLQEKIKISDKPIKCLLETRCNGEPAIISCAGCYEDDEAVLKWTKEGDEKLWTNDPIIEVCPYTNAIKPSPYARSRLPRRTSSMASGGTRESDSTIRGSRSSIASSASSASSVVGSGLAKVQNIFLRVHEKS